MLFCFACSSLWQNRSHAAFFFSALFQFCFCLVTTCTPLFPQNMAVYPVVFAHRLINATVPALQVALDDSASYLILSDVHRKVVCLDMFLLLCPFLSPFLFCCHLPVQCSLVTMLPGCCFRFYTFSTFVKKSRKATRLLTASMNTCSLSLCSVSASSTWCPAAAMHTQSLPVTQPVAAIRLKRRRTVWHSSFAASSQSE